MKYPFNIIWGILMPATTGIIITCIVLLSIGELKKETEWGIVYVLALNVLIGIGLLVARSVLNKPVK